MFRKKVKNQNCPICSYNSYLIKAKKVPPATEGDVICAEHYIFLDWTTKREVYDYFGICISCNRFIWRRNLACPQCKEEQEREIEAGNSIDEIRESWLE